MRGVVGAEERVEVCQDRPQNKKNVDHVVEMDILKTKQIFYLLVWYHCR